MENYSTKDMCKIEAWRRPHRRLEPAVHHSAEYDPDPDRVIRNRRIVQEAENGDLEENQEKRPGQGACWKGFYRVGS